ncbi:inositol monophosphatase 1 [Rhodnius prolixus]|uniref:Inositol-1-monophosphatase n=1 Tax=Rhodnius prolixus TaxID=13249 RepID=R4G4P3_RHOPR
MTASSDIVRIFGVAKNLVEEAGKLITEAIWKDKKVSTKSSAVDFVTESDQRVEKFIISSISKEFPDHKFIAEESTDQELKLLDYPTWIIDPIDGTMNFVHGNPLVCISIGFYVNKEAEFGIIYNPVLKELYTALKGKGAYLNGQPIAASGRTEINKALICFEGGSSRDPEKMRCVIENFTTLYPKVHGFRSYGTAAISMSMLARGSVDAYFEFGPHIWDMAAGSLIIREAGGVVIDPSGGPLDLMSRQFLCASSTELALELSKNLKLYKQQRDDE